MTLTPFGPPSPVDPTSGALSVGVPGPNTIVRIQGDDGEDLPLGETGEIVAEGPQVVAGYWQKPDETAANLPGGALKSGDVGFMNPEGWIFIVDRRKDTINGSAYTVFRARWRTSWPSTRGPRVRRRRRARREARRDGEGVRQRQAGATVTPDELIAHRKERMAAYKYPRSVALLDELPKTVTGKILSRELCDT